MHKKIKKIKRILKEIHKKYIDEKNRGGVILYKYNAVLVRKYFFNIM